jgi:hypothetical protein
MPCAHFQGAPMDISDMRDRMLDIEQNFKRTGREKEATAERLNTVERDLNQVSIRRISISVKMFQDNFLSLYIGRQNIIQKYRNKYLIIMDKILRLNSTLKL